MHAQIEGFVVDGVILGGGEMMVRPRGDKVPVPVLRSKAAGDGEGDVWMGAKATRLRG